MIVQLIVIGVGCLSALTLVALVARDVLRDQRRKRDAREQAELDAKYETFHREYAEWRWRADEIDRVWSEERAA